MQKIVLYLRGNSVKPLAVDEANSMILAAQQLPAFTRGMRALLELHMLNEDGTNATGLDAFAAWDFVLATDWNTATTPQIRVNSGITVSDNVVTIPMTETNTDELIAALASSEEITLGAELVGFEAGETNPGYICQFDLKARNRRSDAGTGSPEPVGDGNYSAAQVDALFAAGFDIQYAPETEAGAVDETGINTDDETNTDNVFFRYRNSAVVNAEWSNWVRKPRGLNGFTPTIDPATHRWLINGVDTGILAEGVDGTGYNPCGAYSAATTYQLHDTVTNDGRLYAYINATPGSGNAPPTPPTASNDYWLMLVDRGATGYMAAAVVYDAEATYAELAIVTSAGSTYQALEAIAAGESPATTPAKWRTLAAQGKKGDTGEMGLTRVKYYPIPKASYDTLGSCVALDDITTSCEIDPDGVSGLTELEFQLKSISEVTGNVRLNVLVDGVLDVSVTLPVTAAYVTHNVELTAAATGEVHIVRDYAHIDDTLQSGGVVICGLRHLYGYEVRP